jgi:polyhydroxyalkanoate synthesis regulator phasin/ribosomal protein S27AE
MKTAEHVEYLLRRGKNPKELQELGFPKRVITRLRRQLKEEKMAAQVKVPEVKTGVKTSSKLSTTLDKSAVIQEQELESLENDLNELKDRIKHLEAACAENASLEELKVHLDGTPALGLKHRFKCSCGASGFVAMHIQCTKCGQETWWGWFPKE